MSPQARSFAAVAVAAMPMQGRYVNIIPDMLTSSQIEVGLYHPKLGFCHPKSFATIHVNIDTT